MLYAAKKQTLVNKIIHAKTGYRRDLGDTNRVKIMRVSTQPVLTCAQLEPPSPTPPFVEPLERRRGTAEGHARRKHTAVWTAVLCAAVYLQVGVTPVYA